MNDKEIKELAKALNKVSRYRVDPLTKLVLLVVIGVPILAVMLVILGIKIYNNHKASKPKELKPAVEKPTAKFQKPSEVYYEVVRLKAEEQSLTQYVRLYNASFEDITGAMADRYPVLTKYSGRSNKLRNTVVMTDFDIIQFQRELGSTELIRTVSS